MPLLAACSQIEVDGWRLWIEGLQPDCGVALIRLVRDAAEALAEVGTPVWVRASDLSRWTILASAGPGLSYRAGRGLWSRPSPNPRRKPERVEVEALAGPVPRDVAERLRLWRPDLLRCDCGGCLQGRLPAEGHMTVLHNLHVLQRQIAAGESAAEIVLRLERALAVRRVIAKTAPIDWHGECQHLAAVIAAVADRVSTPARSAGLLVLS